DLDGGLAVACQIVSESAAIGQILPGDVVLRGERDVPRGSEIRRPDRLVRKARGEIIESDCALNGPAAHRPAVLREDTEVVVKVRDRAVGEGALRDSVGYAVVEPVTQVVERVLVLVQMAARVVEPHLEGVRTGDVSTSGAIR